MILIKNIIIYNQKDINICSFKINVIHLQRIYFFLKYKNEFNKHLGKICILFLGISFFEGYQSPVCCQF